MVFEVDSRIESSCLWLTDWSLSSLYLKKDANFPWIILVPRVDNIQEIYQLSQVNRQLVIEEIAALSRLMEEYFKPDKLNVGALGNIVSQLHIHVVARFKGDKAWPHSIWQPDLLAATYPEEVLEELVTNIQARASDQEIFLPKK